MKRIRVGIAGGAGYTGGELVRLLINHPAADIVFVHSNSQAGKRISDVHTDLIGDTELIFSAAFSQDIDVLFLCVGHGDAKRFLEANPFNAAIKIIDLSQDFRLKTNWEAKPAAFADREFIYGLPEANRKGIKTANHIANPGCFATCIQLALLPLAKEGLLTNEVHISATTGSTGAGQGLSATSHFSWRNNNLSVYKAFEHQHLKEIRQNLSLVANKAIETAINFIPYRGDFPRGIMASVYTRFEGTEEEARTLFKNYYASHPFTHLSDRNIDLKQVINTNKALLQVEKHGDKLLILCIIDNLLKGASGQAVQNMNLMFGLDETLGLRLKALVF